MKKFLQLAEGVDMIPVLHYAAVSGGKSQGVRLAGGPQPPWMECPQIKGLTLDIARRVDAVQIGDAELLCVDPGDSRALALADVETGNSNYYLVVVGCGAGAKATLGEEEVMLMPGAVWWMKGLPLFVNNSDRDLWVLAFTLGLDV